MLRFSNKLLSHFSHQDPLGEIALSLRKKRNEKQVTNIAGVYTLYPRAFKLFFTSAFTLWPLERREAIFLDRFNRIKRPKFFIPSGNDKTAGIRKQNTGMLYCASVSFTDKKFNEQSGRIVFRATSILEKA